jgi:GNAT superfamily N-acetyltransferase
MIIIDLKDGPSHISTLARWHHDEWRYLNPRKTLEECEAGLRRSLGATFVPSTFVALEGDVLVGSASIIVSDMDTRPELSPWLASVYIKPDFRRQGIGSTLVTAVVGRAAAEEIDKLYLFTPDQRAFYQRLGWRLMEEVVYRGHMVDVMQIEPGQVCHERTQ